MVKKLWQPNLRNHFITVLMILAVIIGQFDVFVDHVYAAIEPTITTSIATGIVDNAAILSGSITSMGNATTCDTYFEWSTTSGSPYANTTTKVSTLNTTGSFSIALPVLSQGTIYYYRSKVVSDVGTSYGSEQIFTTTDEDWLYMTTEQLTFFKQNKTDVRYAALKAWGDSHIADPPPAAAGSKLTSDVSIGDNHAHVNNSFLFSNGTTVYLSTDDKTNFEVLTVKSTSTGVVNFTSNATKTHSVTSSAKVYKDYATSMTNADTLRRYIETMCTLYLVENNTAYSNAAILYINAVVSWDTWNNPINWQTSTLMGMSSAEAFDVLHPLMTSEQKNTLKAKIVAEIGALFNEWREGAPHPLPAGYAYPNHKASLAGTFMLNGLALLGEYSDANLWVEDAAIKISDVFATLESGGITKYWYEGSMYASYALDYLVSAMHAYKISGGTDYFIIQSTFLSNMPAFFQWTTYNGHYLQIGDVNFAGALDSSGPMALCPIYRLSKEYRLAQGQQYADTYCTQALMQSFIWRDPTLSPTAFSGTTIDMDDIQIYRSDWTSTGLVIVHHAGTSRGHSHPASGEFQIYYKGKPITGDYGYSLGSWYTMSWTKNTITEGPEFSDGGYTIPGYGQGQEPSDMGILSTGSHGEIIASTSNSNYWYVESNNTPTDNPPFNPFNNNQTNPYKKLWTGNLSLWTRQTVYIPSIKAFVVFDRVSSPSNTTFRWLYHASNALFNDDNIAITVDGDIATVSVPYSTSVISKIVMVDPISANRTSVVKTENTEAYKAWKYLSIANLITSKSIIFQNIIFPDSNDLKVINRVSQGNCGGVIIENGEERYLVLFSTDGNAVNQQIELGNYYQAKDGRSYSFNGTKIAAQFTNYEVVGLIEASPATIAITTSTLPNGTIGVVYSQNLTATGGKAPYTWTIASGTLPAGLSLSSSGVILGTPTTSGAAISVTFQVTDSANATTTKPLMIAVEPASWDVNMDTATNVLDMISLGQHWGESGPAGWIRQDVNDDGIINTLDSIIVGQHWSG